MFDVRRSSFKITQYGINATGDRLQNNLALMLHSPLYKMVRVRSGGNLKGAEHVSKNK